MTQVTVTALTPDQLLAAENFDDGYLAGWAAATASHDTRDELIARRITALLLQHSYNQDLAQSVAATQPYTQRGIPRRVTA